MFFSFLVACNWWFSVTRAVKCKSLGKFQTTHPANGSKWNTILSRNSTEIKSPGSCGKFRPDVPTKARPTEWADLSHRGSDSEIGRKWGYQFRNVSLSGSTEGGTSHQDGGFGGVKLSHVGREIWANPFFSQAPGYIFVDGYPLCRKKRTKLFEITSKNTQKIHLTSLNKTSFN